MAAPMPVPGLQSSSLLYKLDDRMPQRRAALIGLQHVMAMFVGIITPPLILARSLELDPPMSAYLISMALIASGLSTLVQVQAWGPVGSGLLSTQGTSFSFLSPLLQAGRLGGLPLMLGMSLATAPVEMLLSRFVSRLRRIFTPLVSGIVVLLIGLSLVPVAAQSIAAPLAPGAPAWAGLALAGGVIALVVALHILGRPWARMSAVAIALLAG
ncbi:MAG TPA: solute carrier family 23 protein, partial [Acidobacteriota bacterium]